MDQLSFGPLVDSEGVTFRIWAPKQTAVRLRLEGEPDLTMEGAGNGWFNRRVEGAATGTRYSFILDDGTAVPDPASRSQPDDVHGPSEVVGDGTFVWTQTDWTGRPWKESVIYELHVGAFTEEGTFRAAIDKLAHLESLGVTAIQLMPVNDFRGERGWGYDGVLPYAPESSYGRPEDLKAFIDAAHEKQISVFLDVVYNHFGPEGNYLPAYAPLFTDKHASPWGDGVNYDDEGSEEIRRFVIENVIYWISEFRVDGLRFDAVHAIKDDSDEHLLTMIAAAARQAAGSRHIHLIVENEDNSSALLERDDDGTPQLFTAQWNDDIHHVLHAAATGEDFGYYADYAHDPRKTARALSEGFVYQGETMPYRGSPRGEPSGHLPSTAFISFIQNHDQVGNRAYGDRLSRTASFDAIKALAGIYLLLPQIPMIFMGEEWNSQRPFPYFCDFDDELNEKVREGRRNELSRLPGFDEESGATTPDPTSLGTFQAAKLDWEALAKPDHSIILALYRELISIRNRAIVPCLDDALVLSSGIDGQVIHIEWSLGETRRLQLVANLSADACDFDQPLDGRTLWETGALRDHHLEPWSAIWTMREK